jgi:nicotinamidase/pyrazinamidase
VKRALIIVDVQNDFCPGGALAVPNGDQVVGAINTIVESGQYDLVVATQDWHPAGHGSFASAHPGSNPYDSIDLNGLPQVLWPDHCVQNTPGAEFHPDLNTEAIQRVFQKGTDPTVDSYSGFFDNGRRNPSGLAEYLTENEVTRVDVVGLATDYCVKATATDAKNLGFDTSILLAGCRAVNVSPKDGEIALSQMAGSGITLIASSTIVGP